MARLKAKQVPQQMVCDAITAFVQDWDEDEVWATCMSVPSHSCGYNEQIFLRFNQEHPEKNIKMEPDAMVITDSLMKRHHDAHIRRRQEIKHELFKVAMKAAEKAAEKSNA